MNSVVEDTYFSNDLNDLLLNKDLTGFWRTWNAKIGGSKPSPVIDEVTDNALIAQKFADLFKENCQGFKWTVVMLMPLHNTWICQNLRLCLLLSL